MRKLYVSDLIKIATQQPAHTITDDNEEELAHAHTVPGYAEKFRDTRRGTWPEVDYAIAQLGKQAGHETTHTSTLPDGRLIDILALLKTVAGRPPGKLGIADLVRPSRSAREGFSQKRYDKADTQYPLLVGEDNRVIDGRHRYFKLTDAGASEADVVRVNDADIKGAEKQASPQDMWRHYDDPPGNRYAGDVPHGHLITPHGKVDPEFLDFGDVTPVTKEAMSMLKSIATAARDFKPVADTKGAVSDLVARVGGKAYGAVTSAGGKLVNYITTNPDVEDKVHTALKYKLLDPANAGKNMTSGAAAGSLSGLLGGAAIGYGTGDDDNKLGSTARGALTGLAGGAGLGAGLGRVGPRIVQQGIGRVLTNLIDPHIYDLPMHLDMLRPFSTMDMVKSVWKDEPIHGYMPGRYEAFRDFFDLPRQEGPNAFFTSLGHHGDGRLLEHNPRNIDAAKELAEVDHHRLDAAFDSVPAKQMQYGKETLQSTGAMGNFAVKPTGDWEDTWDFALHPGKKIEDSTSLARALISILGTPSTMVGKTLSQGDVIRKVKLGNLSGLHSSLVDPVLNRASRGAGIPMQELKSHLSSMGRAGNLGEVQQTLAARAEGKPYNMLHAIASTEGVTPGDLRVMLGAEVPKRMMPQPAAAPSVSDEHIARMYHSRIPGSTAPAVQEALREMTPESRAQMHRGLAEWRATGRAPGGEVKALADALGFEPGDLSVLLG